MKSALTETRTALDKARQAVYGIPPSALPNQTRGRRSAHLRFRVSRTSSRKSFTRLVRFAQVSASRADCVITGATVVRSD